MLHLFKQNIPPPNLGKTCFKKFSFEISKYPFGKRKNEKQKEQSNEGSKYEHSSTTAAADP